MASKKKKKKKLSIRDLSLIAFGVALVFVGAIVVLIHIFQQPVWVTADCALVIDHSKSVSNPYMAKELEALAKSAVSECATHGAGRLTIVQVSSNGASSPSGIVDNKSFILNINGQDQTALSSTQALGVSHAVEAISQLFQSPVNTASSGSDILGAVSLAGGTLNQQTSGTQLTKYLVVLTDGLQDTSDISVSDLSAADSGQAMVTKTAQLYPDIRSAVSGSKVSFYGVGGNQYDSTGRKYSQLFESLIRSYWLKLVQENGGAVCAYSSSQVVGDVVLNCGG